MSGIAAIIRGLFQRNERLADGDVSIAMGELLDLEKVREILLVVRGKGAWAVPYSDTTYQMLVTLASLGDVEKMMVFIKYKANCMQLVPEHGFDAKLYSKVVVL